MVKNLGKLLSYSCLNFQICESPCLGEQGKCRTTPGTYEHVTCSIVNDAGGDEALSSTRICSTFQKKARSAVYWIPLSVLPLSFIFYNKLANPPSCSLCLLVLLQSFITFFKKSYLLNPPQEQVTLGTVVLDELIPKERKHYSKTNESSEVRETQNINISQLNSLESQPLKHIF